MKAEPVTAAELRKKVMPVCSHCGSPDVRTEAWAAWNKVTQNWMVAELLDGNQVCAACGCETTGDSATPVWQARQGHTSGHRR